MSERKETEWVAAARTRPVSVEIVQKEHGSLEVEAEPRTVLLSAAFNDAVNSEWGPYITGHVNRLKGKIGFTPGEETTKTGIRLDDGKTWVLVTHARLSP